MKKALSMILVLTMVLALALPAMAEETVNPEAGSDPSKDVTASFTGAKDTADKVYYVTISWTGNDEANPNTLAYSGEQGVYTWNGSEMRYVKDNDKTKLAGWTGSATYTVTVTNQSNDAVNVEVSNDVQFGLTVNGPTEKKATLTRADANITKVSDTVTQGKATDATFTYKYAANKGASDPTDNATGKTVNVDTITVKITHN